MKLFLTLLGPMIILFTLTFFTSVSLAVIAWNRSAGMTLSAIRSSTAFNSLNDLTISADKYKIPHVRLAFLRFLYKWQINDKKLLFDLIHNLMKSALFKEAIIELKSHLKQNPYDFEAMYLIALCFKNTGKKESTLFWLKRALEENPNHYESLKFYFFECYYQRKNWEGISSGEKLLHRQKFLTRDELSLINFLREEMRSKFSY